MNFQVHDRVLNIDPRDEPGNNAGEQGTVTDIVGGTVYVTYDNGSTGKSSKPEKYYKRIAKNNAQSTKNMNSITTFIRNFTLSASEKLLRKHGLKTECGTYTSTAQQLVLEKITSENEPFLIEMATKFEAEQKAEKE